MGKNSFLSWSGPRGAESGPSLQLPTWLEVVPLYVCAESLLECARTKVVHVGGIGGLQRRL